MAFVNQNSGDLFRAFGRECILFIYLFYLKYYLQIFRRIEIVSAKKFQWTHIVWGTRDVGKMWEKEKTLVSIFYVIKYHMLEWHKSSEMYIISLRAPFRNIIYSMQRTQCYVQELNNLTITNSIRCCTLQRPNSPSHSQRKKEKICAPITHFIDWNNEIL